MYEKTIAFRIDEELHKRIKLRLVETNMTLKDYVITLIENDLNHEHKESMTVKPPVVTRDVQEFFQDFFNYCMEKIEKEKNSNSNEKK